MNQSRHTLLTVVGWMLFLVLAAIVIFQFARQDKIDAEHTQQAEQAQKTRDAAATEERPVGGLKAPQQQPEKGVQEALKACQKEANDKRWGRAKAVNQTNAAGLTHTDLNEFDNTSSKILTEDLAACDKHYGGK